jgi:PKD repeat protein
MKSAFYRGILFVFLNFTFLLPSLQAQPPGFSDELYLGGWNLAVGFTWDSNGRMYVWEKSGKVWIVDNGAKLSEPMLDISDEVGNWRDFGLLGVALDPNFLVNGYVYLFYVVDRHHLMNFGTPNYDPNTNEYFNATIGRITRYQATAESNFSVVNPASRTILLGETASTGCPILHQSHGTGHIVFGQDGTLIASMGDGASYSSTDVGSASETYWQQALNDGIITPEENIGALRCQILNSLNGKILRLDPATGDGVPSNPYFDPENPRSAASRTWALGVRNAYRFNHIPNTGSHVQSLGDPGAFVIGDVGWNRREECSIITGPAQNMGWPIFEGMTHIHSGYNINPVYFPTQHTLPKVDWRNGPARVYTQGQILDVGSTEFPGPSFTGNAATGGTWYMGSDFPQEYHNTYFSADYGGGWIMNFVFDDEFNPTEIREFKSNAGSLVFVGSNPNTGGIYYIKYGNQLRRIVYNGVQGQPPVVNMSADPQYGAAPLTVQFSAQGSYDPELTALTYEWDFGDGILSNDINPQHVFEESWFGEDYNVTLTVTDADGQMTQESLVITLNNTPPNIVSTSIDDVDIFSLGSDTNLELSAEVSDAESEPFELTYQWQLLLYHNDHFHPEAADENAVSSVVLSPIGCDGNTYWYRIRLTVTDPRGLSSVFEKDIFPDCPGMEQTITFPEIPDQSLTGGQITLNATSSSGLPIVYYLADGAASIVGNTLTLQGVPGEITVNATQPGNEMFAPAIPVIRSFRVTVPEGGECETSGSITMETWTGVSGTDVGSIPVETPPDSEEELNVFEIPVDAMNDYGVRLRGYVCPPLTGQYRFWISSDDNGELWLSTNENPLNRQLIASVPGWTSSRQWDKFPEQQSSFITLIAGQQYYIEALMKEQGGGDNLAVRWRLPTGTIEEPIPGNRLSGFSRLDQSISFDPIPDLVSGHPPFHPNPISSSGLPVDVEILSGPATWFDNQIVLTGEIGLVSLRFTQAGNGYFNAAPVQDVSFSVLPFLELTVSSPNMMETVAGTDIRVEYSITGTVPPGYHLHLMVDNPPHITVHNLTGEFVISDVEYGSHMLHAHLVTSDHVNLTNPEASQMIMFSNVPGAIPQIEVELSNRADHSGEYDVEFVDVQSEQLIDSFSKQAQSDGQINGIILIPSETHIRIKRDQYLSRVLSNVNLEAGINPIEFKMANNNALIPGDVDNDNFISATDLSGIIDAYNSQEGSQNFSASADLNGDGYIDATEISTIIQNFNLAGE